MYGYGVGRRRSKDKQFIFVGSSGCGKTSLLERLIHKKYYERFLPKKCEKCIFSCCDFFDMPNDNTRLLKSLRDDVDCLKKLKKYQSAFRKSFWEEPIILVATKCDLRGSIAPLYSNNIRKENFRLINESDVIRMKIKGMQFKKYVFCSAKTGEKVDSLIKIGKGVATDWENENEPDVEYFNFDFSLKSFVKEIVTGIASGVAKKVKEAFTPIVLSEEETNRIKKLQEQECQRKKEVDIYLQKHDNSRCVNENEKKEVKDYSKLCYDVVMSITDYLVIELSTLNYFETNPNYFEILLKEHGIDPRLFLLKRIYGYFKVERRVFQVFYNFSIPHSIPNSFYMLPNILKYIRIGYRGGFHETSFRNNQIVEMRNVQFPKTFRYVPDKLESLEINIRDEHKGDEEKLKKIGFFLSQCTSLFRLIISCESSTLVLMELTNLQELSLTIDYPNFKFLENVPNIECLSIKVSRGRRKKFKLTKYLSLLKKLRVLYLYNCSLDEKEEEVKKNIRDLRIDTALFYDSIQYGMFLEILKVVSFNSREMSYIGFVDSKTSHSDSEIKKVVDFVRGLRTKFFGLYMKKITTALRVVRNNDLMLTDLMGLRGFSLLKNR